MKGQVSPGFKRALEAEVKRLVELTPIRTAGQPAAHAGRLIRQFDQIPDLMDTADSMYYALRNLERAITTNAGTQLGDRRLQNIRQYLNSAADAAMKAEKELSSAYANAKDLAKHIGT